MIKLFILLLSFFALQGCQENGYSVFFKNVSEKKISDPIGVWGERGLRAGSSSSGKGKAGEIGLKYEFPKMAGARWVNALGKEVEFLVKIDRSKFPEINEQYERYEFIFELRQNNIRQVELVIHDDRKPRTKKRKIMLYCGDPECYFNSPFTTDEYYSPRQLEDPKLQEYLRKQKAVLKKMEKALEVGSEVKPE